MIRSSYKLCLHLPELLTTINHGERCWRSCRYVHPQEVVSAVKHQISIIRLSNKRHITNVPKKHGSSCWFKPVSCFTFAPSIARTIHLQLLVVLTRRRNTNLIITSFLACPFGGFILSRTHSLVSRYHWPNSHEPAFNHCSNWSVYLTERVELAHKCDFFFIRITTPYRMLAR